MPRAVFAWSRSPPRTWPGPSARRATSTAPAPSATPTDGSMPPSATRPHAIHYALKANSTLALVRLMRALGSRVDANSMGEVDVALRCGFAPRDIVFTGVGKSAAELARAVALDVHAINVESPGELDRLDQIAVAHDARGARGAARESRHRRPQPSAHLHRTARQQVRRADRRWPGPWSATWRAAAGWCRSGSTSTSARRSRRSTRSPGPPRRPRRWRVSWSATACRSSSSTSAAGWGSPTTARRCPTPPTTCGRSSTPRPGARWPSPSSRAARSSDRPACCSRRWWTSSTCPAAGVSSCSTPG